MADAGFNGTNGMSFQLTKILTWIIFFPLEANVCSNWYTVYLKETPKDKNQYKEQKMNPTQ